MKSIKLKSLMLWARESEVGNRYYVLQAISIEKPEFHYHKLLNWFTKL